MNIQVHEGGAMSLSPAEQEEAAVLEVGCSPHGLPEDIIRSGHPDLWEAQRRQ